MGPRSAASRRCSTMLNSCSAGVCVVNIDAGFKAGYVAARFVKRLEKHNAPA